MGPTIIKFTLILLNDFTSVPHILSSASELIVTVLYVTNCFLIIWQFLGTSYFHPFENSSWKLFIIKAYEPLYGNAGATRI